jgi:catechol 2,3-dioxygenase-like lactoylglutathione lyase family enzyme
MVRVVGIDHLVIRVSDFEKSKAFYGKLFPFLGFKVLDEYGDAIGWTNGKTRFWIGPADAEGKEPATASAISASTTMPSSSEAGRMSTTWKPF